MIDTVFPLPLKGEYIVNGLWKLTAPFKYVNDPYNITVKTGFLTDGASIPKFAYPIIGPPWGGKYSRAAVIHDFLYHSQILTRLQSDRIFYNAMEILGVSRWRRTIMFFAVRMGGWRSWENNKINLEN